jgi:CubicO group peptidase (beta-lactamase class C family)
MMRSNRLGDIAFRPGLGFGLNLSVVTDRNLIEMPASNGEYSWGGMATTIFWIDPDEELIVVFMTQYLPTDNNYYRDLLHRLVRAAIID